jgi:hypothetical protein
MKGERTIFSSELCKLIPGLVAMIFLALVHNYRDPAAFRELAKGSSHIQLALLQYGGTKKLLQHQHSDDTGDG